MLHLVIDLPLGLVRSFYPLQPLNEHVVNDYLVVLLSLEGGHLRYVAVMDLRYISIHLAHILMEVFLVPLEVFLAHVSMLFKVVLYLPLQGFHPRFHFPIDLLPKSRLKVL